MKAVYLKKVLVFVLVFCLLTAQTVFAQDAGSEPDQDDLQYLKSVMDMIREKYKGEFTDRQLLEGAIKGMFDALDPYTTLFNPSEAEEFLGGLEGNFEGIGIAIVEAGQYLEIVKVFASSPAEKAGLLAGDKLVEVDGKSIVGASSEEAVSLIRGEAGTKVEITVMRGDRKELLKFEVIRAAIKINPVTYDIRDGIGYIKLESFNANTYEYFKEALGELDKAGITRLILDLRNNPGGYVDQAVAVAGRLVPEGLVTKLDFKNQPDVEYFSDLKELKYDLVVLVNGESASASEILAGAIQDKKAGILVGSKTFGKAKVQQLYPIITPEAQKKYAEQYGVKEVDIYSLYARGIMPLKSEIIGTAKITVGEYLTPNGRMIDGTGIEPDVFVEDYPLIRNIDVHGITKLTRTVKPGLGYEGIDVYNAEKILVLLGYDVDQPDTIMDEKTCRAVDKFRRDCNLYPGGVLDFTTQKWLNEKLDELILEIDTQYRTALELLKQ